MNGFGGPTKLAAYWSTSGDELAWVEAEASVLTVELLKGLDETVELVALDTLKFVIACSKKIW